MPSRQYHSLGSPEAGAEMEFGVQNVCQEKTYVNEQGKKLDQAEEEVKL